MRLPLALIALSTLACALGAEDKDTASDCKASLEGCDQIDDDCDGDGDQDDDVPTWYADDDADGYGDGDESLADCFAPAGFVADGTDCNDDDPLVNPGAAETGRNEVDENCDGVIDETCGSNAPVLTITGSGYDPAYEFGEGEQPAITFDLEINDVDGDLFVVTVTLWIEEDGDGTVDSAAEPTYAFDPFSLDDGDTCDENEQSIGFVFDVSNYDEASVLDVGVVVEDAGGHSSEVVAVAIELG
ncbi:MAG: putative metal-binding motif-containing protein [Deltaproteobacteria bacterium]|nr:putative metal-binding motif-containing protein [Deltaproteobacteria bacterium]